jgi:TolA-binding protein
VNRVDLHPEQLFDHLRDGSIKPDEYGLLSAHCEICAPCRLEFRLVFEPMGAPMPDREDRALAMAVVDRMLNSPERAAGPGSNVAHASVAHASVASHGSDSAPAPDKRVRARVSAFQRGRSAAFISAGIVLGCSMTAAALVPGFSMSIASAVSSMVGLSPLRGSSPAKQRVASSAASQPEPGRAPASPATLQPSQPAAAGLDAEPREDLAADGVTGKSNSRRSLPPAASRARSGKSGIDGADALLAAAGRARARGAYAEAADYYRMLQRHYPNTEAEIVARVSLGRLLCLRLAQPQDALELFDDYLSQRPNGALGQEARSGRAQCLERLGRVDEARSAWEELALRHPNSVYADEARVRLALP